MTSSPSYYCEIDFPDPDNKGRFTAFFSEPEFTLSATKIDEVFALLSKAEAYALSGYWVVGFVAYEAAAAFDKAMQINEPPTSILPLAQFAVYRNISTVPRPRKSHLVGVWQDETSREIFDNTVAKVKLDISEGNYYQVNYTTRLSAAFFGDGLAYFDELKLSQPSAYCAYLNFGAWQICSVSPELFFHYAANTESAGELTCRPMKGTARRHSDPGKDQEAANNLLASEKERAENLMIVDLLRNDLSRVALPATVKASRLFTVEAFPTVWQMTSTITCQTKKETGLLQIFKTLFPCGSVTGAPKVAAMKKIKEIEKTPRGVYCGAIGMIKPGGEAIFSVGIRTPVIDIANSMAICGIGSGITMGSEAENEYDEWFAKKAFLLQSCTDYELLETMRLHQGRFWLLCGHLTRIERSAHTLGFSYDRKNILKALSVTAKKYSQGQWRVRLRLSAAGEVSLEALPLDVIPSQPKIAMASAAVASDHPWLRHKTTHREIYSALSSQQDEVFDTLLFNERNELTEFTRGNLLIEKKGHILTPAIHCGLLPGVLREILLKRKRVHEAIVTLDDLRQAKYIWFTNSVRGVIQVSGIEYSKVDNILRSNSSDR
jgi:para-aminobenzoate synthetase/4-amino-4-deoxychorismate lyase